VKQQRKFEKSIPLFAGSVLTLLIILLIDRDFPYVGTDYRYFIPHLIDTNLHIQFNGLSIQWYTPSFGGGLAAYSNPQNLEFSLVQWVSYFLGPWTAILVTTAGISLLGYYYFYRLLKEKIKLGWQASTLGAIFFIGNGFYIEHMVVGQLGYQLFPLGSLVLFLLLDLKNKVVSNALLSAVLMAMMIHQAGFYLIIILLLSCAISLTIIYLTNPKLIVLQRIFVTTVLAMTVTILISSSKIYAVFSLMQQFPRHVTDVYYVGTFQALIGLLAQFLGVMSLEPILMLMRQNTDFLSGLLSYVTGARYGIWETDISISPVLIFFLFVELTRVLTNIRYIGKNRIKSSKIPMLLLLLFLLWITAELTFARGFFFSLTKDLPVLNSLHVNVRFASAFVMPLVIYVAFIMERFFQKNQNIIAFMIPYFLTLIALSTYFFLSCKIHSRSFAITPDQNIRYGEAHRVSQIADIEDWQSFVKHASSYRPYEPLFGYELENFKPATHSGSVFDEDNGYFNMTNPVSLVFPQENNLYPFERFKVSERDKLELFLQHKQPNWRIPPIQVILNYLSANVLIICLIAPLVNLLMIIHQKIASTHNL
jgi:hypothetical protein